MFIQLDMYLVSLFSNHLILTFSLVFRVAANESDTTLIIGGLDWMSFEHLDTIQRVLAT